MPTPESKILFPNKEVNIGDQTVKVRELKWSDTLEFLKQLGGYIGKLMNEKGEVAVTPDLIVEMVTSTDELTTSLLRRCTDLEVEAIAQLPMTAALDLVDAALELNLSDDLIAKGKNIAGRFQKFAGVAPRMAMPASARPTISSSPRDTAESH